MRYTPVTYAEFAATEGLEDWRANMGAARAEFRAPSFAAGADLVAAIAAAADAAVLGP